MIWLRIPFHELDNSNNIQSWLTVNSSAVQHWIGAWSHLLGVRVFVPGEEEEEMLAHLDGGEPAQFARIHEVRQRHRGRVRQEVVPEDKRRLQI